MYDVKFKLADLGLCNFRQRDSSLQKVSARDVGGTREYGKSVNHILPRFLDSVGPPEAYRGKSMDQWNPKITPRFDIWSLGCV